MQKLWKRIRNFSIIAHIDHGKSSLADRLLEKTGTLSARELVPQVLDGMELERERGITIKAHLVTMRYTFMGEEYQLNLLDTPGHVDFSYEVSRSLAACEGALLVVDATQGVQAQTLANLFLAVERGLTILPVLNKIDLPAADPDRVTREIQEILGCLTDVFLCSAKTGEGVEEILEALVTQVPPPRDPEDEELRALVFDSHYDSYRGVLVYVRLISGSIAKGDKIVFLSSGKTFEVTEVGVFCPKEHPLDALCVGEVGYVCGNIKQVKDVQVGDTIVHIKTSVKEGLPGFRVIKPTVFAGIYPSTTDDYLNLREALGKLQLSDSALSVDPETSHALGSGFRCGFLGLLHFEIIVERLQREFDLDIISTSPGVLYRFSLIGNRQVEVDNPTFYPDPVTIVKVEEPWVSARLFVPADYLGAVMQLGIEKRGELQATETLDSSRLILTYAFPLNEIVVEFGDQLKSLSKGYASFDYEPIGYRVSDIVKLEVRINGEVVDAFSCLIHRSKAERKGRYLCKKLVGVIPRHLFKIPIQASVGGKILARETISALAKDVTAKCYGGDITRKRKLWDKQKEGKKRMKQMGKVSVPQKAFLEVLKSEE
ncbi:translation elongation factor 4 [Candidatus Similichlamydia laticola]|uniref:Elongation factor 4 n=1 Tax=Candidatus Similichlamydia laticola TaxID=2170265 RepID=A0A369KJ14_9BACT|nr:translation elongation factor 4 [Candidatus Similichlamydia laticola]RDB31754.1 Translation elongation factor LepA [Candidatus Similichlamydia laticola]